ncbi:NTP transferase domain-containing protein [bacterium]|nr:NTP transferase domain-containing protein [bacterium]
MNDSNKVGVILAAGLGSRLRPSTEFCPKPLIPVAGVEPLFFALNAFNKAGVSKVIVNTHYLHKMIFKALDQWRQVFSEIEIRVSNESSELLGTGGALLKIIDENREWIADSSLVVQNGDTLANFDFSPLFSSEESTLAVSDNKRFLEKYGPLWLDQFQNWAGIGRNTPSEGLVPAHFLGVHKLSSAVVNAIPKFCGEVRSIDLFNGIYRPLVERGFPFRGVNFTLDGDGKDSWFDITNKQFLLEAQHFLLSKAKLLGWDQLLMRRYPSIQESSEGCWVFKPEGEVSMNLVSPCVYVNSSKKSNESGAVVLESGSCWIQEKPIKKSASGGGIALYNSIVLLKREVNNAIPQSVRDDVLLA